MGTLATTQDHGDERLAGNLAGGAAGIDLGDAWLKRLSSCVLLVPSIIVAEEYNALINPAQPRASSISATVLRQFIDDPRLH